MLAKLLCLIIIVIIFVNGCGTTSSLSQQPKPMIVKKITLSKLNEINPGVTKDQVRSVLGDPWMTFHYNHPDISMTWSYLTEKEIWAVRFGRNGKVKDTFKLADEAKTEETKKNMNVIDK